MGLQPAFVQEAMKSTFFPISVGILQGCPISGSIFAAVLDAALRAMDTALVAGRFGMVRACADDLGAVARRKQALLRLRHPFVVARAAAGPRLRADKCKSFVLGAPLSPGLAMRLEGWLLVVGPEWCRFEVCEIGEHIGFYPGRVEASLVWRGARELYRTRALTTLTYVGQLSPLPLDLEA